MNANHFIKARARTVSAVGIGAIAGVAIAVLAAFVASGASDPFHAGTPAIAAPSGIVTFADRESAIQRTMDCIRAQGAEVTYIPASGLRPTRFSTIYRDSDGVWDAESSRNAYETDRDCMAEFLDPVSSAYISQLTGPSAEEVAALYDRLDACVAANGPPVPESAWQSGPGIATKYANAPAGREILVPAGKWEVFWQCALAEEASSGLLSPVPEDAP